MKYLFGFDQERDSRQISKETCISYMFKSISWTASSNYLLIRDFLLSNFFFLFCFVKKSEVCHERFNWNVNICMRE